MAAEEATETTQAHEIGLIVQQPGKAEQTLAKFLKLLLSYKYGLPTEIQDDYTRVSGIIRRRGEAIRCVVVVQRQAVSVRSTIPVLGAKGTIPLFLLLPGYVAQEQSEECAELDNVYVCPWEMAFTTGQGSLQQLVSSGLQSSHGDDPSVEEDTAEFEERLRDRLEQLDTLPTLPAIVLHIMRLVNDPKTTMAQLEELLSSDPAVVLKVVQVANSPMFAGTTARRWNLNEAIVRLGLRKVGAIAQQIALINSFVRPEDSEFEMQRFWEHSVACALVVDKMVEQELVTLPEPVEFNEYWVAALLHDCGKMIQGFFFWEWFERIVRTMDSDKSTFHDAENELSGGMVSHEFIGELLLQKSNMPTELVAAVGLHHATGDTPSPLVALVHVANNITKEIGLGYIEDEPAQYTDGAFKALKIGPQIIRHLKAVMSDEVVGQVKQLVRQCMS